MRQSVRKKSMNYELKFSRFFNFSPGENYRVKYDVYFAFFGDLHILINHLVICRV